MQKKLFLIVVPLLAVISVVIAARFLGQANPETSLKPADHTATPVRLDEKSAEVQVALPVFRRLDENYMRGGEPARGGLGVLTRLGVKTILDLRSEYDYTDEIRVAAERLGFIYRRLPLSVWNPPTDKEANEFVRIVTNKTEGPFFVFCSDGIHRTGEMSAIYRIMDDHWEIEEALTEMDEAGFTPYYYNLRNYVWTYARKFRPAAVPATGRRLSPIEQ
ncbi:MAG TPA: hypothetical protein VF131_07325 [Blastocatellia bacterium]|nr:hypothetical protein [Blastocatellia bacterium]